MKLTEAADELVQFIIDNREEYIESLGLAVVDFHQQLESGETPKMALAFAKAIVNTKSQ